MIQEEIRRRIQAAQSSQHFPPVHAYPETTRGTMPSQLFAMPLLVWVPECREANWKCPVSNCLCTPQVKGYMSREVDDIEHRTLLLFCKYRCRTSGKMFSTLSQSYMDAQSAEVSLHFPYIMTHKFGISKKLMMVIHGGVTSRQGMKSALEGILSQRHSRFFHLRSLFGESVRQRRAKNPNFIAPAPPTLEQYATVHRLSDQDTLTQLWLSWSEIYSGLSEMVMNATEVKKVIRIDHSRKFTSLLKKCSSGGKKEGVANFHLLLLVQNECGQIVARALTSSENSTETESVLVQKILPRIPEQPAQEYFLVFDNATAVRGSVERVFGGRVSTKQDPFHGIQRFTEKVRRGIVRNRVAKELSACLYSANRQLRDISAMGAQVQIVADSVRDADLLCTRAEWESTLASNLRQIGRGDMDVSENFYSESGRSSKVVSTSQLEGVHCQLKKALSHPVSIGVGLRVLDIFILQHNLRVGARWSRNPAVGQADFLQLCQSALLCSGTVPESPLYEFALDVLSRPFAEPRYRLTNAVDFPFRHWLGIYSGAKPSGDELQVQAHVRPKYAIRELMFKSAHTVKVKDISRARLLDSLCILSEDVEISGPLSSNELELLKQVRREMAAFSTEMEDKDLDWYDSNVAATVLYNLAVSSNENPKLSLARRGYSTLLKNIAIVDELLAGSKQTSASKTALFSFVKPRRNDVDHSAHEHAVQVDFHTALKASRGIRHRRRVFAKLYTLAACLSPYLRGKSFSVLYTRWATMNTTSQRHKLKRQAQQPTMTSNQEVTPVQPSKTVVSIVKNSQVDQQTVSDPSVYSANPKPPPAPTWLPTSASVQPAPAARPDTVAPATASSSFIMISEEHLQLLANEAATFGRIPGKWSHVYSVFLKLYPSSALSLNALQCRLKPFKIKPAAALPAIRAHATVDAHLTAVALATTPTNLKRRSSPSAACTSCAGRHKKCGRDGDTACLKSKKTKTNSGVMDSFLL